MKYNDPKLEEIANYVQPRLENDPGHDFSHCQRVARWTIQFGEGKFEDRLAIAASLLHDIVNLPKNHPEAHLASQYSAEVSRKLLKELLFDEAEISLISDAILDHSYSRGKVPTSYLGKALQDADRLEALGALGIFRLISTGTKMGARYFNSEDPWAQNRVLDDKKYSLDHFFTKLLKLPATMTTEAGRNEAERRCEFIQLFLDELHLELEEKELLWTKR